MTRWRWWLLLGGIVVVAVGTWVAGVHVRSTSQAAANAAPPPRSIVTAPVEQRVLSSTIVSRGLVVPAVSTPVNGPALHADAAAITTAVPVTVGETVDEGDRVLEVSGRPVFVLAGTTPAFRTMQPGLSGADVAQLQAALGRLGCDAGASGTYDEATKQCVTTLYTNAGYEPARSSATEAADLVAARAEAQDAQYAADDAAAALWAAAAPPADAELIAAQNAVAQATRARDQTKAEGGDVATANETLREARAQLDALTAPPDTSAAERDLERINDRLATANEALTLLEATSGATVPYGEVVFVPSLPARVDAVSAVVGQPPGQTATSTPNSEQQTSTGALLTLSSGGLRVEAAIGATDRGLLRPGMDVDVLDESTGEAVAATLESIGATLTASGTGGSSYPGTVVAVDQFPDDWSGRTVRVTFTAAATDGEVLVVPLAAVTSTASGQARVEVQRSDGTIDVVAVEAGLSADGFVAVTPTDGALDAGDRVVVGR